MTPSFMPYDLRDPEEIWRREERLKLLLLLVFVGTLFVGILHFCVEPKIPLAEAAEDSDVKTCKDALWFHLNGYQEIVDYCISLKDRGL